MLNTGMEEKEMNSYPIIKVDAECKSILQRHVDRNTVTIYMTHINEEEEAIIDSGDILFITRDGIGFSIIPRNIYCYGEVNFDDHSSDLDTIDGFNWFSGMIDKGVVIPSNYDYETHSALSDLKKPRWTETFSPAVAAQITHGMLGKPKRIIIFKYVK